LTRRRHLRSHLPWSITHFRIFCLLDLAIEARANGQEFGCHRKQRERGNAPNRTNTNSFDCWSVKLMHVPSALEPLKAANPLPLVQSKERSLLIQGLSSITHSN
jgi:hypothetical protein